MATRIQSSHFADMSRIADPEPFTSLAGQSSSSARSAATHGVGYHANVVTLHPQEHPHQPTLEPTAHALFSVGMASAAFGAGAAGGCVVSDLETIQREQLKCRITTFLVLSKRLKKVHVYRFNKARSLWLLSPTNPIRVASVAIITNQFFELFILVTILANCVLLAVEDPPEEAEYVFSAIYTLEMLIKIAAKGFILHTFAYLRDPWSWLDFIVVCLGYITLAPDVANLSGIRTFRVLRALRTISAVEGLKTMVNALLKSMRMLTDVLVLTTFFLCVFALIGMQFFAGNLRRKCVRNPTLANLSWTGYISNSSNWFDIDGTPILCGNSSTARHCPSNYTCQDNAGPNPNHGFSSYDHFGWALISSLQLITLDYWEDLYLSVTSSSSAWSVLYFMPVIFFGSFYLINLVLAVVAISYQQETTASVNAMMEYEQLKKIASSYSLRGTIAPKFLDDEEELRVSQGDPSRVNNGPHVVLINITTCIKDPELGKEVSLKSSKSGSSADGISTYFSGTSLPPMPYAGRDASELRASQRLRRVLYRVIATPLFDVCITAFIFVNTICLAIEYPGMDSSLKSSLETMNHVCTLVFVLEMIVKLIALSPRSYIKSQWNIFDGLVVSVSVVDWCVEMATQKSTAGISILRSFRLLRVLKLAQSWSTMRMLLSAIGRSVGALSNLTLILAIVVYMFAVVGGQLFKTTYAASKFPDKQVPRWNFSTFGHSFMMIFRILCGEWVEPLYDCMLANGYTPLGFFLPALVLGNFLVLNLFLALLLNSFADQAFEEALSKRRMARKAIWKVGLQRIKHVFKLQGVMSKKRVAPIPASLYHSHEGASNSLNEPKQPEADVKRPSLLSVTDTMTQTRGSIDRQRSISSMAMEKTTSLKEQSSLHDNANLDPCFPACFYSRRFCAAVSTTGLCLKWRHLRLTLKVIVEHKWFDNGLLALIVASSFILVFEDVNLPKKPKLEQVLNVFNIFFTIVFFIEFVMKAVGLGLYPYLKNAWNCLDLFIVSVSIAGVIGAYSKTAGNFSALRSIRTLRALRPLRAISKWDSMKIVVNCLLHAIPSIGNVLLVCLMFWLIFSIMGVQYFGSKFYKCVDASGSMLSHVLVPNKTMCYALGHTWKNSNVNFDNALNGFLALLEVATFEGWMEVMRDAVDATEIDSQPVRENNFVAYFYFVGFIIIGSFFTLNLFISVIIDNFYKLKKEYDECDTRALFLTPSQKKWLSTLKKAVGKKPKKSIEKPKHKLRAVIFRVVSSPIFEVTIMVLILLNIVAMAFSHYNQPDSVTQTLVWINGGFTVLFGIEVVVRVIAFNKQYFYDFWNLFDLSIVILSFAGIILEFLDVQIIVTPSILRVIRVLRVGRLLRFIKGAKGIRKLLVALLISMPSLFNIGALLFLIIFIYAIMGMSLFGSVKHQGALNDVVNFETFSSSMVLLFRLATSAGWNEVLDSLLVSPPDCDPKYGDLPNGNCGSSVLPVVYFVTFILISFMIIVNMYIAIILENFTAAHNDEEVGVTEDDIEMFYIEWQKHDPDATQYLHYDQLSTFVAALSPPLRIPKPNSVACSKLNIPMVEGDRIHCVDVLKSLLHHVVGGSDDDGLGNDQATVLNQTIEDKLLQSFPMRARQLATTSTQERMQEIRAALIIQRHFIAWKQRRQRAAADEEKRQTMNAARDATLSDGS